MPIPDGERIVSDYLRSTLGARVVGQPPSNTATPWLKVVQLDARQAPYDPVDHLVEFYFQVDCYAGKDGGQPEAKALGDDVRDALVGLRGVQNGAVVTAARIAGHARIPDATFEPARERMIVSARVWIHA